MPLELVKTAGALGFVIDTSSNRALSESLEKATTSDPYVNKLLKGLATTAMAEAEYFSTGSRQVEEFYHYGLAEPFYTHFTSPIRRYADTVVHRILLRALELENNPESKPNVMGNLQLEELAHHINIRNRNAKNVQRSSTDLFHVLYFKEQKEVIVDSIISQIRPDGFFVFVPSFGLQSVLNIKDKNGELTIPSNALSLSPDNYESKLKVIDCQYDEVNERMIMKTSTQSVAIDIFDHITIKISVGESRGHLPPIKIELVHFGEDPQKKEERRRKINVVSELLKEDFSKDEEKKYKGVLLSPDEKPYKQTNDRQSLYMVFDSFDSNSEVASNQRSLKVDPLTSMDKENMKKTKWKRNGRRAFLESDLPSAAEQRKLTLLALNKTDAEEEDYYDGEDEDFYEYQAKKLATASTSMASSDNFSQKGNSNISDKYEKLAEQARKTVEPQRNTPAFVSGQGGSFKYGSAGQGSISSSTTSSTGGGRPAATTPINPQASNPNPNFSAAFHADDSPLKEFFPVIAQSLHESSPTNSKTSPEISATYKTEIAGAEKKVKMKIVQKIKIKKKDAHKGDQ